MLSTRFDPFREFERRISGYLPSESKKAPNVAGFTPAANA